MVASAIDSISGKALVTPPITKRPWAQYELRVCQKGTTSCRVLSPLCTASASRDATTECAIPGLEGSTNYTVVAVAIKTVAIAGQPGLTVRSMASAPAEFATPRYP